MEIDAATQLFTHTTYTLEPLIESSLQFCPFRHSNNNTMHYINRHQIVHNNNLTVCAVKQFGSYGAKIRLGHLTLMVQAYNQFRSLKLFHRVHDATHNIHTYTIVGRYLHISSCSCFCCTLQILLTLLELLLHIAIIQTHLQSDHRFLRLRVTHHNCRIDKLLHTIRIV